MGSQGVYNGSIALIGGGIAGTVLAIALTRRGLKVALYEQAHKFGEIGAGVAFNPSAVRAMRVCAEDIHAAFTKVVTTNGSPEKATTFFDFLNGEGDTEVGQENFMFSMYSKQGANSVHRAHFLDEVVKLVPEGITHFAKHLDTIEEQSDGKLKLLFRDGSSAIHDVVIGTDGIKSSVRRWLVGENDPAAKPTYTNKYAYRGLIPMDRAVASLGEGIARNAKMHLGQDGHMLTFPVDHGSVMNVVAFWTDKGDWPDYKHLTRRSTREQVHEDYKGFGATVHKIIDLLEPDLDCWAIFDLGSHPLKAYNRGCVAVLGDAAHATSPHHGSGASHCIEDSAVLAELLADPRVAELGTKGVEAALDVYSRMRIDRANDLVQSSRRTGEIVDFRAEYGGDVQKIEAELKARYNKIWVWQIKDHLAETKEMLANVLQ